MSCLQSSDPSDAPKSQWPPVGWDAYYGKRNRICSRGYNCYTTTCTCGPSQLLVTGTPHILKEFSDGHGDHRPEYRALKRLPDEVYADGLSVEQRVGNPRYRKYQQRLRSLGFFTTAGMLEKYGIRLPEEQQRYYDEHLSHKEKAGPSMQHAASAATASSVEEEEEEEGSENSSHDETSHGHSGGREKASFSRIAAHDANTCTGRGGRKLQVAPVGTTVYYGRLSYKKQIAYRVTCTCRGAGKQDSVLLCVPHEIRHWAEKHGDCKPEFRALKALEDEQYSLLAGFDSERIGDPRYKKYQKRMRDLGFFSTVPMLEDRGYCLPEEAQARYDSLYPKRERRQQAPGRRVSSIEESASQSEDSEDMDDDDEEASHSRAYGCQKRPKRVVGVAPNSRKRARKAPAAGLAIKAEPAEPAGAHGLQDAAAERSHRIKRAKKMRTLSPARELHAAAVALSIKVEPATPMQPPSAADAAAADNIRVQRGADARMSAAPVGQLTCAAGPSTAANAPNSFIRAEPAGSAEPPFTPDAAVEGTRKRRRTCAMQPVDLPPLAAQSTPTCRQALSNDMDGAVDLTLDSPTSSGGEGSHRSGTGVYTLSDAIADIARLKALQLQIAAGGVCFDINKVLQCLQAASTQERHARQPLETRITQLQAEASAEGRNHQALLELQRQMARNEKLLAAKDNEIKALREQVELQRG